MPGPEHIEVDNRGYQQRLAASLVGTMGVEDALQTCLAHGWDGVLERVLCAARKSDGWPPLRG